jgi:hypothetical protein
MPKSWKPGKYGGNIIEHIELTSWFHTVRHLFGGSYLVEPLGGNV